MGILASSIGYAVSYHHEHRKKHGSTPYLRSPANSAGMPDVDTDKQTNPAGGDVNKQTNPAGGGVTGIVDQQLSGAHLDFYTTVMTLNNLLLRLHNLSFNGQLLLQSGTSYVVCQRPPDFFFI